MFKNRFTLITVVLFVLLVSLTVASPFSSAPESVALSWPGRPVLNSAPGANAPSDYYQRHPELRLPVGIAIDMTDYFMRHPELRAPAKTSDLTDYFFRQSQLWSK